MGSDAQQWQQRQAFSTESKCSLSLEGVPRSRAVRVGSVTVRQGTEADFLSFFELELAGLWVPQGAGISRSSQFRNLRIGLSL